MPISEFQPLPKKTFETLANEHSLHCVSIYLPMHKTGKEQNERLAQANLKHCIKEVHKSLTKHLVPDNEITHYLKPIEQLIAKIELWRNPSDGLAIFLDRKGLSYYPLPITFNMKTEVADHFYLKPLLPLYHEDGDYYLLELSEDYVKLYKASRYGFKDIYIEDFAPDQLEKAVGFDYRPKMLQFRSGQDSHATGAFHGRGEGKDDTKKELLTFFNAIDKGVKKIITNQNAPLVVACVDSLFYLYKKANSYSNLFHKNISGDPEFKNKNKMHQDSWRLIQPHFEKTKKVKLDKFTELYHTPKVSYEISEIIPAAVNGKIDTLFIQKNADLFGIYNSETGCVRIDKRKEINNASLDNLTSMSTFKQGGKVYFMEADEMPIKDRPLNALFRY